MFKKDINKVLSTVNKVINDLHDVQTQAEKDREAAVEAIKEAEQTLVAAKDTADRASRVSKKLQELLS